MNKIVKLIAHSVKSTAEQERKKAFTVYYSNSELNSLIIRTCSDQPNRKYTTPANYKKIMAGLSGK